VATLVVVAVAWEPLMAVDRAVAEGLHADAVRRPLGVRVARVLTDWVWDPWTLRLLLFAVVAALWRRGERGVARWLLLVCGAAALVQQSLKALVDRERPRWPDPVDSAEFAAFPSGHAMTAAVVWGLLWWVAARAAGALTARAVVVLGAVSTLGVGLTRMYLGVHWFSDVIGGWLLGGCLAAVAVVLYERRGPALRRLEAP
jgi:undecaprenyl-diphosphatase